MANAIPFLLLLSLGSVVSQIFERRLEETVPFVMLSVIMLFFITGMAGCLRAAFYIAAALFLTGTVYLTIIKKWRWDLVLTPGALFLCLLFLFAVYYHQNESVVDWDELGQWALAPKNMYVLNQIPTPSNSNVVYVDYPPASALWSYFWMKMTGRFQDSSLYVGMMFLNIGILAPALRTCTWKNPGKNGLMFLLLLVTPCAFTLLAWKTLLIDYLLGAVTVYIFCEYSIKKRKLFDWGAITVALFVVLQIKSTGLFFAAVSLIFISWDILKERGIKKQSLIPICLLLGSILLSRFLWSGFIQRNAINKVWAFNDFSLSKLNVFSQTNGVEEYRRIAFANCFRVLIDSNFSEQTAFYVHGVKVPLLVWYLITVALSVCVWHLWKKNRTMLRAYVVWGVANIVFAVSVAYVYYFQMSESECAFLSAYSRYMSTMISAVWMYGIAMLILHMGRADWMGGHWILLAVLCLMPNWSLRDCYISSGEQRERQELREERRKIEKEAEQLIPYILGGETIVFNGQTYVFNYLAAPARFRGPLGLDVFTDFESFLDVTYYNTYAYFSNTVEGLITDEFKEAYSGNFWAGELDKYEKIAPYSLYRLAYGQDGMVVLEWVETFAAD